jgi:catechol 2,3-dioxygenase-like lactoylglutathione lyase family enzyme
MDPMIFELRLGPIGQISRNVSNIDRAIAFYRDTLGLPHLYTFGKLSFFDCGGTRLFLQEAERPGDDAVIYFRVADIHGAYEQLCQRGLVFEGAPHRIHRHDDGMEEWMAFFKDPDDRLLAIMCQVPG